MRLYTRIIFGLNCFYQLAVGTVFMVAPVLSIALYGFPSADKTSLAAHAGVRALGAFLLVAAVISAMIALNPDRNPVLLPIMALVSALTLVCWSITVFTHEMTVSQVAVDMVVQVLLLIGALGYFPQAAKTARAGMIGAHA